MERTSMEPKMFHIIRHGDESGVSGTGRVLDGVVWPNGWVNIYWRTDLDPVKRGKASVTFYESFDAFEQIHITSHPTNETEVIWDDVELAAVQEELDKTKTTLKETRKKFRDYKSEHEDESDDKSE
jgi:hypothetical protein